MRIPAKTVVLTSFYVDLADVLLSLLVTLLSGSVIMLSQVLQGVADLSASLFLVIGLHRARRPADKAHPFGHGKEMYFWALLAAFIMLFFTAGLSLYFGWRRLLSPEPLQNLPLAYGVLTLTALTNGYSFSLSFRRLLRHWHPKNIWPIFFRSSLVETKATFILDLMATLASLLGLLALVLYRTSGDLRFDGLGAIVIGLSLFVLSFFLLIGVQDLIIGRSAAPELVEKIAEVALSVPGVKSVTEIKTVYIGPESLLVNVDVSLEKNLMTPEIEGIIRAVKEALKARVERISETQVEISA